MKEYSIDIFLPPVARAWPKNGIFRFPKVNLEQRQIVEGSWRCLGDRGRGLSRDLERALIERFGFGVIAHGMIQRRQIVEGRGGVWVIGAEGFLVDLERALIERFGFGVIAHGTIQRRQIVEGRGGVWVIGAEGFLV